LQKFFFLSRYHYCIAVENLHCVVVIGGEVSGFESLGFAVRVILGFLRVSVIGIVENSEWLYVSLCTNLGLQEECHE